MSYTPTTWQTGDTITAEKLNNMESGIENANNPFVVTLTPTAQDFSGTMDKTIAEINAAYNAGRRIMFALGTPDGTLTAECTATWNDRSDYPSFNAFIVNDDLHMIMLTYTGATYDGDANNYYVTLYPLTPMS